MLNGAIVGFGEVARHGHWPAYVDSRQLSIVAVVDRSPERRTAAKGSSLRAYESMAALAAAETIDFIDICTPPAVHNEPMLAALERGWHVVCEKPFLLDASLVARVRACAEQRGVAVVPVHNWKFAPIVREATARLRRGAIGTLERVEIDVERTRPFRGAELAASNWRLDPAVAGGGILMDHGWHAAYLALHWFQDRPARVEAALRRPAGAAVEDEADMQLTFPCGEAAIRLTWDGASRRNTIRLTGDRGSLTIADDRLIARGGAGENDTMFSEALSAGSHHPDWFAAFIPTLAGYFEAPSTSRAELDEAAACLDIIQRAYNRNT